MEEGVCSGCGREGLEKVECGCGRQELIACKACLNSGINLVCGDCRDRALRVVLLASYACRDFVQDEAGVGGNQGKGLPVCAPVGA